MPSGPRAPVAIFDFDGTLADTWRDIANALNLTLEGAGLPVVTGPEVRFWIGEGALKLLERAVPASRRNDDYLPELYEEFRGHYDRCCLETTETYAGIMDCLDALDGVALAVLSNKPSRFLQRVIEGLGLKGYFRVVVAGDTLPIKKPSPGVVAHLLEHIDVQPSEVWMVGDSGIDIETGKASGSHTIGCAWGLRGRDELREAGADYLIESPREIPPLITSRSR